MSLQEENGPSSSAKRPDLISALGVLTFVNTGAFILIYGIGALGMLQVRALPFEQFEQMQSMFGAATPQVTAIALQLHHTAQMPDARRRLEEILRTKLNGEPLAIVDYETLNPFYGQTLGMFAAIFGFISVLIGAIVLFTVTNTMGMAVVERTAEIGTLRAIGLRRSAIRSHAERLIATWDVRCEGPGQRIGLLSGGNIQKLLLGRVLEAGPALLLADQPTRGLDVGAVAFVHGRLLDARRRGAAILLISEDLDELLRLSDRIAVMHRGRLSPALPAESLTIRELGLLTAEAGDAALADDWLDYIAIIAGIVCVALLTYIVLRLSSRLVRFIGPVGVNAMTKIMGFLIMAIGVQFVVNGVLGIATDPELLRGIRNVLAGR